MRSPTPVARTRFNLKSSHHRFSLKVSHRSSALRGALAGDGETMARDSDRDRYIAPPKRRR